jgi:hypothetical protein
MASQRFEFGDRVRHAKRPEWGIGSVVKAEPVPGGGAQRLTVRFGGAGVKTLDTGHAELQRVVEPSTSPVDDDASPKVTDWDRMSESDWLAPMAQRKIEEAMVSLPEAARDAFRGLADRVKLTLDLFRFDRSGRSLVEWAVAQTGLDDPLSRFNRHELEQYFDRWSHERDQHLRRLLRDCESENVDVSRLLDAAAPTARAAARRVHAGR